MKDNMYKMSMLEKLTYSTVLIHCEYENGVGTGTGFIINLCGDRETQTCIPVLITNKHVVDKARKIEFEFCKATDDGEPIDTKSAKILYEGNWINHPNQSIDLCCLPIGPALNGLRKNDVKVFYIPLETSLIPNDSKLSKLSAMEDVVMIGYPIGLSDEYNHKPIIRKGITATHPKNDYQGKKHTLIDMACYPGSSGSPVFIANEGSYTTGEGIFLSNRIYLLGVLFGGPQYTAQGSICFSNIPNTPKSIVNIPTNLGVIIKANEILDFENAIRDLYRENKN